MADVNRGNRPLSPHLQVYRPQLNMITSILTRITGISLLVGAFLIVWWFIAAASGPEYYAYANAIITSWFGDLVMLGSLWALWYHALAGVRHLVWDTGRGFDLDTVAKMSWGVIVGSFALTVFTIIVI